MVHVEPRARNNEDIFETVRAIAQRHGLAVHEHWTAKRDANAALHDAYTVTAMRDTSKAFDFAFPDLTGHTVTSKDPRFNGKVVIVALAGSWCPNCHDEAAFLAPLYEEYRSKGLAVVSLQFEHFGDFARAAALYEIQRRSCRPADSH